MNGFTHAALLGLKTERIEGVRGRVCVLVWMDDDQCSFAIKSAAIDSSDRADK